DGAIEPPRTGLRRVLPTHTAPPPHGTPAVAVASAVAVEVAGQRPALLLRQVQGAALPNPLYPRGRPREGTSAKVSTASFSAWFNHARISRSSTSWSSPNATLVLPSASGCTHCWASTTLRCE